MVKATTCGPIATGSRPPLIVCSNNKKNTSRFEQKLKSAMAHAEWQQEIRFLFYVIIFYVNCLGRTMLYMCMEYYI